MNLHIASKKILILKDQISHDDAKIKAIQHKIDAFGALSKFSGVFSKPNEDDFEIIYEEHRFQPFWHVVASAHYVYERSASYEHPVPSSEVVKVTFEGKAFDVSAGKITVPVLESCSQDLTDEVFVNDIDGKKDKSLLNYLKFKSVEMVGEGLPEGFAADTILVPPKTRITGIMREMLAGLIKGIQADKIFEEKIEISSLELVYRPVYAFQFNWKSKSKSAILEVDAVTGNTSTGTQIFRNFESIKLDRDFLFDITADAVGMFVPGGSIAVKAAKKVMDANRK